MLKRNATILTATIVLWSSVAVSQNVPGVPAQQPSAPPQTSSPAPSQSPAPPPSDTNPRPAPTPESQTPAAAISPYEGKTVLTILIPGVADRDREHILQLLAQKAGQPLDRTLVRDSIRALYATGLFADIQAEVTPAGDGVTLSFPTSANFFVGAVDVEGAPSRPNENQIVNASKFQLGERYTQEKLDRAIENVRQLMQEGGYYRASVSAESTANPATQQVDLLFHITPGEPARVGEVKVTGTSNLSSAEVQRIAHLAHGGRLTAARVSGSLQRLRKRFQKQNRALAQVSIADQPYHTETNTVDFTFQIDPGPVVVIYARGFPISAACSRGRFQSTRRTLSTTIC